MSVFRTKLAVAAVVLAACDGNYFESPTQPTPRMSAITANYHLTIDPFEGRGFLEE